MAIGRLLLSGEGKSAIVVLWNNNSCGRVVLLFEVLKEM